MICPKCSYTLTLLFTSTACDRCDGLLKQETVGVFKPGARVCFLYDGERTEFIGVIDSQQSYETWRVIWDHAPQYPTLHESEQLVLV